MLLAALALFGRGSLAGYTVTDIGRYYVTPGTSQVCINARDEIGIASEQAVTGPGNKNDVLFNAYFWSKGKATTISDQRVSGRRVVPMGLTDKGVVIGQILDNDFSPKSNFTWSKGARLSVHRNASYFRMIAVQPATGALLGETGTGEIILETLLNSKVTSSKPVRNSLEAHAFNRDNVIVGSDSDVSGISHAFYLAPGKDQVTLPFPPLPTGANESQCTTEATAINDQRYVAGVASITGSSPLGVKEGMIWSPAGMVKNVVAAGGVTFIGINNHNRVIGWKGQRKDRHAVIYDATSGLRDLNLLVPAGTPTLSAACAINDNGSIVCVGENLELFLLKPAK